MKALAPLLLTVFIAAGCDLGDGSLPRGDRPVLPSGAPPAALAGVVATDSVTTETRRLMVIKGGTASAEHITPDGRGIVGTNWSTGDVVIRSLTGEDVFNLTRIPDPWGPGSGFGIQSRVSPDGNRVAFTWYDMDYDEADLRIARMDGGDPEIQRVFAPQGGWPGAMDWSPDGERLLVAEQTEGGTHELLLLPASGGEPVVLKSLGWSAPQGGGFSPDGNHVAFDFSPDLEAGVRDIHVVSVDGDQGGPVVEGPWNDYFLGWAPDGHILFLSDRGDTRGIWRIAIRGGRPHGEAELVKPDVWRALGVGFDRDGRFHYNLISGTRDIHVATLDLDAGRIAVPPAVAVPREIAGTLHPRWSPDGQRLAYLAERTPWGGGVLSDRSAMVRSLDTGEVRRFALPARTHGELLQGWSADGRFLLLRAVYGRPNQAFLRVDVSSGEVELFLVDGIDDLSGFVALPDGAGILAWRSVEADDAGRRAGQLLVADPRSGEKRIVVQVPDRSIHQMHVEPSPDGRRVAAVLTKEGGQDQAIHVYHLDDGSGGSVVEADDGFESFGNLSWSADGSALHFMSPPFLDPEAEAEEVPLWRIELGNEAATGPRKVAALPRGTAQLAFHPNGRRVAFQAGQVDWELWVMERIGPLAERTSSRNR